MQDLPNTKAKVLHLRGHVGADYKIARHLPKHSAFATYIMNYEIVLPVAFFLLHPHRQERLLSTWPLTEVMWRLSVFCSRLELTLILWTK